MKPSSPKGLTVCQAQSSTSCVVSSIRSPDSHIIESLPKEHHSVTTIPTRRSTRRYRNVPRVHFHIHDRAVMLVRRSRWSSQRHYDVPSGFLNRQLPRRNFSLRSSLSPSDFLREALGLRFAFLECSKPLDSSHCREAPWPWPRLHFHTGAVRGVDSSPRWTATYRTRIHTTALRYPSGRASFFRDRERPRRWGHGPFAVVRHPTKTADPSPSGLGTLVTARYHQLFRFACLPSARSFTLFLPLLASYRPCLARTDYSGRRPGREISMGISQPGCVTVSKYNT